MAPRIHPTAEVLARDIGEGTVVWQYCVVLAGARIGRDCNINCHVFIENDVVVGDRVTIKSGVQLWDGIRLADGVFVGPNVTFSNDPAPRSKRYPDAYAKTVVGEGASIGANATLLSGIEIGRYAMIGAGSVVTRNIPPFALWVGNPARPRGFVARDGTVLGPDLNDKAGRAYVLVDGEPVRND